MKRLTHCPICGTPGIAPRYQARTNRTPDDGKSWTVSGCAECGHAFMNPQPEADDLAPYYSADYEAYDADHGARQGDDAATVAEARRAGEFRHIPLPEGKRLLDVGCGAGWFLRICRDLGADIQGVEPSPHGAAIARRHGVPVFGGALEDFAAAEGSGRRFDLITANHVVEHVPDPVGTLRLMKTLLAPGGLIWIAVPNARGFFGRMLGGAWHSADLPYHIHQFSQESLRRAAELAGMEVARLYTSSLPSANAASLRSLLRRYLLPHRLTQRISLLDERIAPWIGRKLDSRGDGEALIVELRRPPEAPIPRAR